MKELIGILEHILKLEQTGEAYALATVVDVAGSTYRRAGARMLISASGQTSGTISGGCLEGDVFERARQVIGSGEPQRIRYDTTSEEDIYWGTGMGCGGVTDTYIDRPQGQLPLFRTLLACLQNGSPVALATLYAASTAAVARPGQRLLFDGKELHGAEHAGKIHLRSLETDLRQTWQSGKSANRRYGSEEDGIEAFIEYIGPAVPLLIFGGGHDVYPLLDLADLLGFHSTVVEYRPALAVPERFHKAQRVLLWAEEDQPPELELGLQSCCVIMTHQYLVDKYILRLLLTSPAAYIGFLGPKKRARQLLDELIAEGLPAAATQQERFFSPVGLDIGADNAAEIALSIMAEIQAVLNAHQGGFLREQQSSIHRNIR